MKKVLLPLLVALAGFGITSAVNSKATVVYGGVIHFRGEIVEGPCDFSFKHEKSQLVEKCGTDDPVSYDFNKVDGVVNYIPSTASIQHETLTDNVVMVSVVYQ